MSAKRLGKGTVDQSPLVVYSVPEDFITIIKTVSLCNIGDQTINVSVELGGVRIVSDKELEPNDLFNKGAFDHLLYANEELKIITDDEDDNIAYYVSGKQRLVDDIEDETVWMEEQFQQWWQDDGPVIMENQWEEWWNSEDGPKGDGGMEDEWEDWFQSIQDATYVTHDDLGEDYEFIEQTDFDQELNNLQQQINSLEDDINELESDYDQEINILQQWGGLI